jgi:predicted RNA-binding protein with PIN domain
VIIIIDGYNLLKQVFPKVRGRLDKQRQQFIKMLGHYKFKKGNEIKEIIVVFDGGEWGRATREIRQGIVVVFSGQKSSADDWIYDYAQRHKNKEILLITKDRELIDKCKKYGIDAISVYDFYDIIENTLLGEIESELCRGGSGSIRKYESSDDFFDEDDNYGQIDSQALDLLMEQASFDFDKKEEDDEPRHRRKGKSKTLSKKEKKLYKKIKKL